jgi:hypothetical protein
MVTARAIKIEGVGMVMNAPKVTGTSEAMAMIGHNLEPLYCKEIRRYASPV